MKAGLSPASSSSVCACAWVLSITDGTLTGVGLPLLSRLATSTPTTAKTAITASVSST